MRTYPKAERTLTVSNLSSLYCDVYIADEGLTLRFERVDDGVIRCTARSKDHPHAPDKASRDGFNAARKKAIEQMNILLRKEAQRSDYAEPLVESGTLSECVLFYASVHYSYVCPVELPLTWENLKLAATFTEQASRPLLTPEEINKLKKRAFGRIQGHRRGTYANDGVGAFIPTKQLSLALPQAAE